MLDYVLGHFAPELPVCFPRYQRQELGVTFQSHGVNTWVIRDNRIETPGVLQTVIFVNRGIVDECILDLYR